MRNPPEIHRAFISFQILLDYEVTRLAMLLESVFTGSTRLLLENMIYVLIIIVVASVIAKMIATATTRFGKKVQIPHNIISLMNKIIIYFIAFVSLVLILQIFNFDLSGFVASFGIMGLIIGIGAQAVISNIISGILIMFEKPFIIGDFVEITDFQGKVEDIKLRSTSIKTFDGRIIIVPNSMFTSNAVVNYWHQFLLGHNNHLQQKF